MPVLHRRRDYLRSRGRFAVNQYHQRHGFRILILRTVDFGRTPLAPAHRDDLKPLRQKHLGHPDRLIQQPARIAPQFRRSLSGVRALLSSMTSIALAKSRTAGLSAIPSLGLVGAA